MIKRPMDLQTMYFKVEMGAFGGIQVDDAPGSPAQAPALAPAPTPPPVNAFAVASPSREGPQEPSSDFPAGAADGGAEAVANGFAIAAGGSSAMMMGEGGSVSDAPGFPGNGNGAGGGDGGWWSSSPRKAEEGNGVPKVYIEDGVNGSGGAADHGSLVQGEGFEEAFAGTGMATEEQQPQHPVGAGAVVVPPGSVNGVPLEIATAPFDHTSFFRDMKLVSART